MALLRLERGGQLRVCAKWSISVTVANGSQEPENYPLFSLQIRITGTGIWRRLKF
jgi:hypothetical protein